MEFFKLNKLTLLSHVYYHAYLPRLLLRTNCMAKENQHEQIIKKIIFYYFIYSLENVKPETVLLF